MKTLLVNKTTYILFPAVLWSLLVSFGHKPHTFFPMGDIHEQCFHDFDRELA